MRQRAAASLLYQSQYAEPAFRNLLNLIFLKIVGRILAFYIGSNSDALANEFVHGAKDAGHEVEKVNLREKSIQFCKGCLACQRDGVKEMFLAGDCSKACVIKDDAAEIVQKMHDADVICWATPIYYYEMSGQMKVMID